MDRILFPGARVFFIFQKNPYKRMSISGLVVEYIVAIDVTRVRFPADALLQFFSSSLTNYCLFFGKKHTEKLARGAEDQSRHQLARVN